MGSLPKGPSGAKIFVWLGRLRREEGACQKLVEWIEKKKGQQVRQHLLPVGNALRVLSYSHDAPEGMASSGGILLSVNQTKNHCRNERCQHGHRYIPKEAHRRILLSESAPTPF